MEWSGRFLVAILPFLMFRSSDGSPATTTTVPVRVGVVVDLATEVGRKSFTCISMALEDFYQKNPNCTTRLELHVRDSRGDVVSAAHAAEDLIKNDQVQAIIGPQNSAEAELVAYLGSRVHIPIISFAASAPALAPSQTPFFVCTGASDASQALPIVAILASFRWRAATVLYEGSPYGTGILRALVRALQGHGTRIVHGMVVPIDVTDDGLDEALHRLMSMPTRVFVVHMLPSLAARLFRRAKIAGAMSDGRVWIATAGVGMVADSLSHEDIDHMEGVVTLRPYVPATSHVKNFSARFKARFDEVHDLDVILLWAYDTAQALARAVEMVHVKNFSTAFQTPQHGGGRVTGLDRPGMSTATGATLLDAVLNTTFDGLAGKFRRVNGELQPSADEIVNIVGKGEKTASLCTPESGIHQNLGSINGALKTCKMNVPLRHHSRTLLSAAAIGSSKRSKIVTRSAKLVHKYPVKKVLKIGVPRRKVSTPFVRVVKDPITKEETISGYSIDIFRAVVQQLQYPPKYKFILQDSYGSYEELVQRVASKFYDAAVGDVTIMANRSKYVDFTMPYTDSGVSMLVLTKNDTNPTMWIFLRPLTKELWCAIVGFFLFTGLVVWIIELPTNPEFQGSRFRQFGTAFYFAFSTMTFSHDQIIKSLMSKIVVVIWCFVVLVLVQSYTANLSSMLTARMLQPSVTDLTQLRHNGDYVGYQEGSSYLHSMLRTVGFQESKIRPYPKTDDYATALRLGSRKGGVSAIFDDIPYLTSFLEGNGNEFEMVGRFQMTSGFGFVLPKGSPLVQKMSDAILNITEGPEGSKIKEKWFPKTTPSSNYGAGRNADSPPITLRSFSGLFIITGSVSTIMLLIHFGRMFYTKYTELRNVDSPSQSVHRGVDC